MHGINLIKSVVKLSKISENSKANQFKFIQKIPFYLKAIECDYGLLEKENEGLSEENISLAKENALLKKRIVEQERFYVVKEAN